MSSDDAPGSPAHPERDAEWDENARGESPAERLDRNWGDLVQELRVVQTGVQFLTGFLLTLPFQQRFTHLTAHQQALYLATVSASIAATAFLQAPVSVHRALFRRHQRQRAVLVAHRVAMIGIAFLATAVVGVAAIIFDVVSGTLAAAVAAAAIAIVLGLLWLALPLALRGPPDPPAAPRRS
jgi:O-antigen/teichoic acid export membrane protein